MATVRDKLWLWGQSPDGHNAADGSINYNLPGHSRMTAMEGNIFFGIPNCCRVRILGHPQPPYDQESLVMDSLDQVVWSLLGGRRRTGYRVGRPGGGAPSGQDVPQYHRRRL